MRIIVGHGRTQYDRASGVGQSYGIEVVLDQEWNAGQRRVAHAPPLLGALAIPFPGLRPRFLIERYHRTDTAGTAVLGLDLIHVGIDEFGRRQRAVVQCQA
ncbi:hypothetical protein D3C71_1349690 [compost metagenome]